MPTSDDSTKSDRQQLNEHILNVWNPLLIQHPTVVWKEVKWLALGPDTDLGHIELRLIELGDHDPYVMVTGISQSQLLANPKLLTSLNDLIMEMVKRNAQYQPE